jgi:hypothetical protein
VAEDVHPVAPVVLDTGRANGRFPDAGVESGPLQGLDVRGREIQTDRLWLTDGTAPRHGRVLSLGLAVERVSATSPCPQPRWLRAREAASSWSCSGSDGAAVVRPGVGRRGRVVGELGEDVRGGRGGTRSRTASWLGLMSSPWASRNEAAMVRALDSSSRGNRWSDRAAGAGAFPSRVRPGWCPGCRGGGLLGRCPLSGRSRHDG